MKELWRPVVGYENLYEVSNLGRVRSIERLAPLGRWPNSFQRVEAQIRPARVQKNGYHFVSLRKPGGHRQHHLIHRLVLTAFEGVSPAGYQANHKDFDKSNNRLGNLEWVTPSQNQFHRCSR